MIPAGGMHPDGPAERPVDARAQRFGPLLKKWLSLSCRNLPLASEVSSILFLTTLGVGAFALWRSGQSGLFGYLRLAFDPAMASILLVFSSLAVPSLMNSERLQFPLNLTLPPTYIGILVTFKVLKDDGRALTYNMGEASRVDLAWYSPSMLGAAFVVGVVALSMVSVISKRHRSPDGTEDAQGVQ